MEIFPNWTVIPIVFFLISFVFILNRTFFRPLGQVLEQRDRMIYGAKKEAEEIRVLSQDRLADFERRMREIRRETDVQMAGVKTRAQEEKNQLILKTRSDVERMIAEARKEINQKTEDARTQLETQSHFFAYEIASRILGRQIDSKKS